jgi:branched-chain amino acid transport system substrate-binding protein
VAVADRAQQLGVLNISLNGKEGISARGAYLFQNALTPSVQLDSLISHCIQDKGFKQFAILAPDDAFGKDMAYQFWNIAEKKGGKIVGFKTYPPKEKDFQNYVKDLIGLGAADLKNRKEEVEKLAQYKAEQKKKTGREPRVQLPPIINFEALFIPDSPAAVGQIAASLAYFDATGFALLGTTEWNSDALRQRGGRHVEGALFPGSLSMNSDQAQQKEFINNFIAAYGTTPDLLSAQSYEAMYMLSAVLKATSSANRNAIVNKLGALQDFATPLGPVSFDGTRIARRKLPILRMDKSGSIVKDK